MIQLPINVKELDKIILAVKLEYPELYNKLWTYKINYFVKEKK